MKRNHWHTSFAGVTLLATLVVAFTLGRSGAADQPADAAKVPWPCFRGPACGGTVTNCGDLPLPTNIDRDKIYSVDVGAAGRSSPIVTADCVYLTGEGNQIMAFERASGKSLWQVEVKGPAAPAPAPDDPTPAAGGGAGDAAPTPVTDGKRIYALFGDGVLGCVDTAGKQIWSRNLIDAGPRNVYGLAASTLLYGDTVIQLIDQGNDPDAKRSFVAAYRTSDGSEVWRTARPVGSSWATPIIARGAKADELITCGPPWIISYDPKTGKELWRADGQPSQEQAVSPVQCGDKVLALGPSTLIALKLGGQGNVTKTGVAWSSDESPAIASPAAGPNTVYSVSGSTLTCLDAANGKETWHVDLDGEFYSSPVAAGDRVYIINNDGVLFVVSTVGKKLAQVEIGEPLSGAVPAVADGRLYIRTAEHLLCLGKK